MEDLVAQALDRLTAEIRECNTRLAALEIVTGDAYRIVYEHITSHEPLVDRSPEPLVPPELVDALQSAPPGTAVPVPLTVPGVGDVVAHVDPVRHADPQAQMRGVVTALRPFALEGVRGRTSSAP